MDKWADYLISEASYDPNRLISNVTRHKDTDKVVSEGMQVDRATIFSDIKKGLSHITIYSRGNSWRKGYKIKKISVDGNHYFRIDENKVKLDYFGDLPEVSTIQSKNNKESQSHESKRPKGVLPKESPEELPQELDLVPEPIIESDEVTAEQLLRLEQLEKQIRKFSRKINSKKSKLK